GNGEFVEIAAPKVAAQAPVASQPVESASEFEQRTTSRELLPGDTARLGLLLPGGETEVPSSGPHEAIKTYQKILDNYPNYERNDKVLYQMSRAHDEIGQTDEAMSVMERLVTDYPYSKFIDEVHFRRGEYYFVRKRYLDAEVAYKSVIDMGTTSSYYELALYKQGWAFYKQELYEEALHNYVAMLDFRLSIGYDFDDEVTKDDEHRVGDTFRVISLSFSNLGGPEVVDEYFSANGHRSYADKVYGNLGEFYFGKLRYNDAASVYKSFIALNPLHRKAPHFGMRIVDIYGEAGFPRLVVEAKKDFATNYAFGREYWRYFPVDSSPEVVAYLQTNLTDLAGHYHALFQAEDLQEEKPANFSEAQRWYRLFLQSFPVDGESPQINYRLADLLLENESFGEAATEYERTAYDYPEHEQASAAGYAAVFAHRQDLENSSDAGHREIKQRTVGSSLRFADTFPQHEQAPIVLGAAADDLYELEDFELAITSAEKLIARYPAADSSLLRSAWAVVAHSSIDTAEYQNAEHAYANLLALTPPEDESRAAVIDGLAASIYKQGEQANMLEDYRAAASHFLRIKIAAPTSGIRTAAEYDAASALMKLEDWAAAAPVLEEFRVTHQDHELGPEATKQLAFIYREAGQIERSAAEHERIAAEAPDAELSREALLTAGELYDEVNVVAAAIRVYEKYVSDFPRPLDIALQTRTRLAEIYKAELDDDQYYAQLNAIVSIDRDAAEERTDRSRYLAANAALVLAEQGFVQFTDLDLAQPFEESLARKQQAMDVALAAFDGLVAYEVAETTAAATFYIAEIYQEFSTALIESERPADLSDAERVDYEMVIEEEAFPFEERAISVHTQNFELLTGGIYNQWVQKSIDQLAILMPGRYAKNEISGGFIGSIDTYAYRMPVASPTGIDENGQELPPESSEQVEAAAQIAGDTNNGLD
ncbi:MAG: tetratricopeptide repeat protein, partial [Proteobacteria bacterium]|nr:tetratricopeptide repeat protein [Pseudomonadota bacterium]